MEKLAELRETWKKKNLHESGATEYTDFLGRSAKLADFAEGRGEMPELSGRRIVRIAYYFPPDNKKFISAQEQLRLQPGVTSVEHGIQLAIYHGDTALGFTIEADHFSPEIARVCLELGSCEILDLPSVATLIGKKLKDVARFDGNSKYGREDVVVWATTDNPDLELAGADLDNEDLKRKLGSNVIPTWTAYVVDSNGAGSFMRVQYLVGDEKRETRGKLYLYRDDRPTESAADRPDIKI